MTFYLSGRGSFILSLHKYASRDPLSAQTGIQGVMEFALQGAAFVCTFGASRHARRQFAPSPVLLCFVGLEFLRLLPPGGPSIPHLVSRRDSSFYRAWDGLACEPIRARDSPLPIDLLDLHRVSGCRSGSRRRTSQSLSAVESRRLRWADAAFGFRHIPRHHGGNRGVFDPARPHNFPSLPLDLAALSSRDEYRCRRKLSTAVLLLLLPIEYLVNIRTARSWRVVALVSVACLAVCTGLA